VSQTPTPLAAGEGAGFEANAAAYGNAFAQEMAFGGGSGAGDGAGSGDAGGFAWAGTGFGEGQEGQPPEGEESGQDTKPPAPKGDAPDQDTRPPVPKGEESDDPMEPGEAYGVAWGEGECSQGALREQEAAQPLEISVNNSYPDPATGGEWSRTTVGVGEEATFACDPAGGTWPATGGTGTADPDGLYQWQAPGTPGSVTITYTAEERTGTVTMTVVEPERITSTKTGSLPATRAGAGMSLNLTIHPLSVCFANAEWYEVPGPGTPTGYFERFPASDLAHDTAAGAGHWVNMGFDNQNVSDRAGFTGWGRPWSQGTWTWSIPTHYRAAGGPSTLFHTETQVMTVTNTSGDATVSKYGQSE
jgi:hypothetical protein